MDQKPQKQNAITDLINLDNFRYENLFDVYQNDTHQYFYNLLTKVNFPENMDETFYTIYSVPSDFIPYTMISNQFYGTITLWWVICAANQISNPVHFPRAGTQLKILNASIVRNVIQQLITNQ